MIQDGTGNELLYWPVTGLVAGEDSDHLTIRLPTPQTRLLRATTDVDASVMARRAGTADAFVNIAVTPMDLSGYAGPSVDFEIFVRAGAGVTGLIRTTLSVGAAQSAAAQWTA